MSSSPHFGTGQTHLNSDAKIADEGRPQGAPLPIVFSRRYALGRAPTRGAPTDCLLSALCPGEGTHKGRPYRLSSLGVMAWGGHPQGAPTGHPQGAPLPIVFSRRYGLGRAPTRGAPTYCLLSALCPGEGTHKGRPYRLSFSRRYALGRAPTRGAPTDCLLSALWPGEGAHKGRPYRLSSLGVMAWGGHPQGAPLPIVFSRRYGLGRAPLPIVFSRRYALGRAPTRGAPTYCPSLGPGEGAHKGRPYRLSSLGVMAWGGHPQGAPLPGGRAPTRGAPTDSSALGRAPTRGAPTDCVYGPTRGAPKGAHKGRPYRLSSLGVMPWGGHPQGAPLPIVFSRRYGLGRAPTRGAPTDCLLSALWPGEGTHKGRPYRLFSFGVMAEGAHKGRPYQLSALCPGEGTHKGPPTRGAPTDSLCPGDPIRPWGGHPQGAPLPDSGSLTWVCPNLMQLPCILGCTRLRWAGRGHSSEVEEAVARVTVGGCKMAQTFLSVYQ